jgi:hypothetical protein
MPNPMAVKTMFQTKENRDRLSILITKEWIQRMNKLIESESTGQSWMEVQIPRTGLSIMLEVYDPAKAKPEDLQYTANLQENGWKLTHVTVL